MGGLSDFLTMRTAIRTDEVDRTISAVVKALYSGRDMTADDVALAIGVSHGTLNSRLRCKTSWTAGEVHTIAALFDVTLHDIYTGFDGKFPGPTRMPSMSKLPRHDSNVQPAACRAWRRPTGLSSPRRALLRVA